MPNWCNNTVEINHPDPAKMYALVEAINAGNFCKFAVPIPEDLNIVAGSLGDADEQKKLEEATARNVEKYGYGNWYDYCVAKWGTKWDVDPYEAVEYDSQHDKNGITFGFDSAWAPPVGVYEELVEQGYSVRGYYYEPGMAFCGVWDEGYDDYFEIGNMSWEEVRDEIPEALDEMFGISENIREWAEEEEADSE